jgi:hypothetical protein
MRRQRLNLQLFAGEGVYPVFGLVFSIGIVGATSAAADMKSIKDMETFNIAIDGKIEEWIPMDTEGWLRRLMTSKSFSIGLKGKRNIGDAGNDYVAGLAWKTGSACSSKFEVTFPDGAKLSFNCIVNVKTPAGGDSTNASILEFDVLSDGKPTYADAVA